LANDAAGNTKAAKTAADTSTTVAPTAPQVSSITLTASVASGSRVTLTAVVAPPSGTTTVPTGTVTLLDGTTTLGAGTSDGTGTSTYTTTALPVGTDSLTAQYGGGAVFTASTSTAVSVVVGNPGYSLSLSPTSSSVARGNSASIKIGATSVFDFASTISFACSGLPANSSCSVSPATATRPGCSYNHTFSRLLIVASIFAARASCGGSSSSSGSAGGTTTPAGTYTITLTGLRALHHKQDLLFSCAIKGTSNHRWSRPDAIRVNRALVWMSGRV
jgi:hypothetical protein